MDNLTKINLETEELCLKTLEILNEDAKRLENTNKNLNNISSNIENSNIILDNIRSLNTRIYNYFISKKKENNDVNNIQNIIRPNKKINLEKQDTIHNQLNNIKKLSIVINNELEYQNNLLEEINNKSKSSMDKLNNTIKKF